MPHITIIDSEGSVQGSGLGVDLTECSVLRSLLEHGAPFLQADLRLLMLRANPVNSIKIA